jgi:hypothetical protein
MTELGLLLKTWMGYYPKGIRYRHSYAATDFQRVLNNLPPLHLRGSTKRADIKATIAAIQVPPVD